MSQWTAGVEGGGHISLYIGKEFPLRFLNDYCRPSCFRLTRLSHWEPREGDDSLDARFWDGNPEIPRGWSVPNSRWSTIQVCFRQSSLNREFWRIKIFIIILLYPKWLNKKIICIINRRTIQRCNINIDDSRTISFYDNFCLILDKIHFVYWTEISIKS